jgi:D-glycero-alpha-D-manno-heptose 1-phosphate guanylyltransferase
MIRSAIILAGGFGTRLQSVVKDVPKPMADIAGKPFLEYLLRHVSQQGIEKIILCVGYKWESIREYFGDRFQEVSIQYSIEDQPLKTGGAILKAVRSLDDHESFVFNGDTFFDLDLPFFCQLHEHAGGLLSVALKRMNNFDRYGAVRTNSENRILEFEEKRFHEAGNINAGVYLLNRRLFDQRSFPEKFSFEKELMERYCREMKFFGFPFDGYFIDIGIPEDYSRAQQELPALFASREGRRRLPGMAVDKSWTLFLDRDGVLNRKIEGDYVRNLSQFEWLPGVQESLVKLSQQFGRVIIVSNQQGVGKGLMTAKDVETIHEYIISTIRDLGGRIDRIYFAPQLSVENSPMRKPGTGMALQAQRDFPDIDFSKSVMVGDSVSDMVFGKAAGMKTVFITHGKVTPGDESTDGYAEDLSDFLLKLT